MNFHGAIFFCAVFCIYIHVGRAVYIYGAQCARVRMSTELANSVSQKTRRPSRRQPRARAGRLHEGRNDEAADNRGIGRAAQAADNRGLGRAAKAAAHRRLGRAAKAAIDHEVARR